MASTIPMLPFLRPLGLPRPSTIRRILCFSTTPRCRAEAQTRKEDPNLTASRTAPETYPPPSMKSLARPKESRASHRTAQPTKKRLYPTKRHSHHQPAPRKLIPDPIVPLPAVQCAPNLPYYVNRTSNHELPVYQDRKRGGNLLLTQIRKIDGRAEKLRDELRRVFNLRKEECVLNGITGHVILKGHRKLDVVNFLRERLF